MGEQKHMSSHSGRRPQLASILTCTGLLSLSVATSILLWSGVPNLVFTAQAATSAPRAGRAKLKTGQIARRDYGPGFYNHSGCLYVHLGDGGLFEMITADEFMINETLELAELDFEKGKSRCSSEKQTGKLSFSYKFPHNKRVGSIIITMRILPTDSEGYWEVNQANLTITRADIERKRTFALKVPAMHAGAASSYSCSQLVLSTLPKRRGGGPPDTNDTGRADPMARIVLPRFQLQPFGEQKTAVFATSYDCSTWFTIPSVMGLILVLFITLVTTFGVALLKGIETNDFKFNREGLQFTQAQMETNKAR